MVIITMMYQVLTMCQPLWLTIFMHYLKNQTNKQTKKEVENVILKKDPQ